MSTIRRGLGRGLSALIPPSTAVANESLAELDLDAITPNPRQPRQDFDSAALEELALSIRQHGLIQPLVVTRSGAQDEGERATYTIIAGERRWRAARLAGLVRVPAVIKEASDQAMLELALIENVQRADLNPLEEAAAYAMLIEEFGLTQAQVAERVGKARVTVTNALRLLRLSEPVKDALTVGAISEAHARALVGLEDDLQAEALALILRRNLTVRQTEEMVRRLLLATAVAQAETSEPDDPQAIYCQALENTLRDRLGTKVEIARTNRGRGRLVIHFYSDEELQSVYEAIIGMTGQEP